MMGLGGVSCQAGTLPKPSSSASLLFHWLRQQCSAFSSPLGSAAPPAWPRAWLSQLRLSPLPRPSHAQHALHAGLETLPNGLVCRELSEVLAAVRSATSQGKEMIPADPWFASSRAPWALASQSLVVELARTKRSCSRLLAAGLAFQAMPHLALGSKLSFAALRRAVFLPLWGKHLPAVAS